MAIVVLILIVGLYIWLYKSESEEPTMLVPGGFTIPEYMKFMGVILLICVLIMALVG